MLTVYIARSGKNRAEYLEKCLESLGKLPTQIIHLGYDPRFDNLMPETKFKMVIYDDEALHEWLRESIPEFMRFDLYDYYAFYKKDNGNFFLCPRLFRSRVRLRIKQLYPAEIVIGIPILNGWLLSADSLCLSE